MSTISGYTSSSISTLFSGLGNSKSGTSGLGIDLSTYSSIKTGSYKQLLRAYYSKESKSSSSASEDKGTTATTISSQKINATQARDASKAVVGDVSDLKKNSLWEKKTVTGEDGTTTKEYDKDAIYKSVSSFVKNYNSLVEATGDSDNTSTLRTATNMVNFTKKNENLLKQVGITIDSKNKLNIDETSFKNADMSVVKSLFSGSGSYGQSVSTSASSIYSDSVSELARLKTQNMYDSTGSYSYVTGSLYNQFT